MPQIDWQIEELMQYRGKNPRPEDFDDYWEKALAELDQTDPHAELLPADYIVPHSECFHLWFTGVGGARIHAKYARPKKTERPHPAVLNFHGYRWHCAEFSEMLAYTSVGFSIASMDCRGQGGLSQDNTEINGPTYNGQIVRGLLDVPEKLLFRQIFLDTVQLARVVMAMEEVDENRVGAWGGSQGGGLALACAALEPRIRNVAVKYPFLCDYQRAWEMDQPQSAFSEIKSFFRNIDPRHLHEQTFFTKLGYIDVQHLVPRIQARVHMACGLSDVMVAPSTQFAAYNKIVSDKELSVYPDFGHEELPGFSEITMQEMLKLQEE